MPSSGNLGEAVYTLRVDDTKFEKGLKSAEKSAGKVRKNFRETAQTVGKFGAGAAIAAFNMAAPFQQAADEIKRQIATATGASGEDLKRLSDQVRDVAGRWGSSWEEAGKVVAAVANIPTVSEKQEQAILDLTASYQRAGFDVEQYQLAVTTAMRSGGLEVEAAADIMAHFALESQATGVSADVMARQFEKASAKARETGMESEQLGILISQAAEMGGQSLVRELVAGLSKATTEAEATEFAAGSLGLEVEALDAMLIGAKSSIAGASGVLVEQNQETLTAAERWDGLKNRISGTLQEGMEKMPDWAATTASAFGDVQGFLMTHSTSLLLIASNTALMTNATLIAQRAIGVMGAVLRIVTTTALGPIMLAITALAMLALVVATNWDTFKDIFISIWNVIKAAAASAIGAIIGMLNKVLGTINSVIGGINAVTGMNIPTIPVIAKPDFGVGSVRDEAGALMTKIKAVDLGELLGNTRDKISGLFGGGDMDLPSAAVESIADMNQQLITDVQDVADKGTRVASKIPELHTTMDRIAIPELPAIEHPVPERPKVKDWQRDLWQKRGILEDTLDSDLAGPILGDSLDSRLSKLRYDLRREPTIVVNIQGDVLDSEESNVKLVSEIEKAIQNGRLHLTRGPQ